MNKQQLGLHSVVASSQLVAFLLECRIILIISCTLDVNHCHRVLLSLKHSISNAIILLPA
jgi:hypothetical protein